MTALMVRLAKSTGNLGCGKSTWLRPRDAQGSTGGRASLAWAANSTLAFLLAMLHVPHLANPLGANPLDDSWRVDNYLAVLHHLAFGATYVWTYGPLGFVESPIEIDRGLLAVSDVVQMGFATLLAVLLVRVLRQELRIPAASGGLIIGAMFLPRWPFNVGLVAVVCALMCLLVAEPHPSFSERVSGHLLNTGLFAVVAGFLLTVAALMKVLWLPMLVGTSMLWGAYALRRGMVAPLTGFVLSSGLTWFGIYAIAGGGVGSGLRWPIAESPIVFGYTEAMSLGGSAVYILYAAAVAFFTGVCGLTVLLRRRAAWWYVASVGLLWLIAFKEGSIRQDVDHVPIFAVAASWCAFLLWCVLRKTDAPSAGSSRENLGPIRVGTAGAVAACSLGLLLLLRILSIAMPAAPELRSRLADFVEAVRFIESESYSRTRMAEIRKTALEQRPALAALAPLLEGRRTFAWPWDGNAVVAAGGIEVFPPIPQEYSVYTSSLDRIDANFFSSPNRPQLGLISVAAIDGRLPLQTAGLSFVRLLSCYRPIAVSGNLLLVTAVLRSDACTGGVASPSIMTPWQRLRLGDWVAVPSVPQHVTLAQIRIARTFVGTLSTSALPNTRPLHLRFRMIDGTVRVFRVVHQTLPDGVLVSTVPSDARDLADVWLGHARNDVAAIALETRPPLNWVSIFVVRFVEIPLRGGSGDTGPP